MSLRDASNPASLRRADLLKLLDLIVGLHETTDPAALPHRMMEAMLQLVPADAAGYSTIDLATGRATNDSTFGNPPEFVRAIERNMAQHPVIAHLRTHVEHQARAISDFTSPAAFQSLALYDELYRPMRVQDQIAIALKSGSTLQIGLTASRNAWGFSSRERLLFTLLRPHVLYCHENARRLTELKAQSDAWLYRLEQLPQGLAARDRGGRWLWITARARDMAQRFLPAARGEGGPVRDIIDRWASAQVARRERALGEPQALVLAGSDGHLTLRLLTLTDGSYLVQFEEDSLAAVLPALCRSGLTAREAEVMCWVLRGKTNKEIGATLDINPRTVHKHLEHVFLKWGVETRTAAAKRARELIQGAA